MLVRGIWMNNIEKKLDALIDALGFDVEEVVHTDTIIDPTGVFDWLGVNPTATTVTNIDYKLTKKPMTKERREWLIKSNMYFTLATEEGDL